ncbi:MAG: GspMb/PilO family protein, partial [Pseudomonadota bacterium]
TGDAIGKLATARAEHARLAAIAASPAPNQPLLTAGLEVRAADIAAARAAMMQRVQSLAKASGVLVEETSAVPAAPGLAALRIRVSGAEKAVVALVDSVERAKPLMRLRRWRLDPVAGGGIRMTGDLVVAWQ